MFAPLQDALSQLGLSVQTLIMFGVGLGTMLAFAGLYAALFTRDPVLTRIAKQAARPPDSSFEAGLLRPVDADPTGLMRTLIPVDRKERTQVQRQLSEAGLTGPHALRTFYLTRLLIGLVLPGALIAVMAASRAHLIILPEGLALKMGGYSPLQMIQMGGVLVAVGFFGPVWWLRGRVAERRRQIEESFPNILDLMQVSVESGLGLDAAMIRVANESITTAPALAEEFLIAQREIQAGRSRDKALMDMAARTGVPQVNSFASVVLQSLHYGSSITDALAVYSEEMRQWRELKAQEMANKLPVKMSAIMASLMLPALLMLALGPVVIRYMRYMAQ